MGSYTTGNPTAAANPASNYLTFIALNTSINLRRFSNPGALNHWVFIFFFSFFKSYGFDIYFFHLFF